MDRKDDGSGLEVTELTEGGGAAEAGIQLHDVLIPGGAGKSCAGIRTERGNTLDSGRGRKHCGPHGKS